MKRSWTIRRQYKTDEAAVRRWDEAYQKLLAWGEEEHEGGGVHAGIDATPSSGAGNRATTGATEAPCSNSRLGATRKQRVQR